MTSLLKITFFRLRVLPAVVLILAACFSTGTRDSATSPSGSDEALLRHASAAPLDVASADMLLGNDAAFRAKLDAIRAARTSIDAMYFIFADDISSSVIAQELLAAAAASSA